jgi:L-asparaginase
MALKHQPVESRKHFKVLVLNTGGSLGQRPRDDATETTSSAGYLAEIMKDIQELERDDIPTYDVEDLLQLIETADLGPAEWIRIVDEIEARYNQYDGFVIVTGTDTMAYTASALSFMLQNLERPVIVTGCVIPFEMAWNDARRNLIVSLIFATVRDLFEVCIFFGDKLFRGNRCRKMSNIDVDAFDSPNYPSLGMLSTSNFQKGTIQLNWNLLLPPPKGRLQVHRNVHSNIMVIRLVPGFSDESLLNIIHRAEELNALVLELYGTGNPTAKGELLATLQKALDRGILVVASTQCVKGQVDLHAYALGHKLLGMGVMSAGDMTTEAAVTKLTVLQGCCSSVAEIQQRFATPMAGEMGLITELSKL